MIFTMENLDGGLSSSLISPAAEVDDISVFVKQILLRSSAKTSNFSSSSSSSSSSTLVASKCNAAVEGSQIPVSGSDRMISQLDSSSIPVYCPTFATYNKSSSSVGTLENDTDEYDGESEDEFVEETPTKPAPQRSSSKRSRAAEIHNLSEKRRRSRINEKMNALQNLIPNSNKTDKASMLDEAIEYLKQLQLQVQMLTMRNGLGLYPDCLPGMLHQDQFSQMKMGFVEGNDPLNMSTTATSLPPRQSQLPSLLQSFPNMYTASKGTQVSNSSALIDLAESSGLVTSYVGSSSLEGIQRQETSSLEPINEGYPTINPFEFSAERITPPSMNENIAWFLEKRQAEYARFRELEHTATMSPIMESIGVHRRLHMKKECNEL